MDRKKHWRNCIVEILKEELEVTDVAKNYSQWVLGVSIREESSKSKVLESHFYTARVVVKTSDSIYVDGMDIAFWVEKGGVQIDPEYFENGPDFEGGTVTGAFNWLEELGNIQYLRLANPFEVEKYRARLENAINTYDFKNLMEYSLGCQLGRNLEDLYSHIIETTLQVEASVVGEEVSDGKYELDVFIGDEVYHIISKDRYMKEDIADEIEVKILLPILEKESEEADKYVK